MKKIRYIAALLCVFVAMLQISMQSTYASGESITVSTSATSATVGDTVTVTVTASSDMEIVGGGYTVYVNGVSLGEIDYDTDASLTNTFTFTADAAGTYEVTLGPSSGCSQLELIVWDGVDESAPVEVAVASSTATVTATEPETTTEEPTTEEPTTEEPTTEEPTTEEPTTEEPTTEEPTTEEPTTEEPTTEEATTTEEPTTEEPTTEETTTEEVTTTVAATMTGIEVSYVGGDKKVGDTVSGIELSVMAVYDDGTTTAVSGWNCNQVGQALVEGDNVFTVSYNGLSTELVITASASTEETDDTSEESTAEAVESETETETETETVTETDGSEDAETETNSDKIPYIQVSSPFGGDDLYLASDWDVTAPDGFVEDTITYAGYTVKVVKDDSGLTLVYMTDVNGENGDFYIYDSDTEKFSYYTAIPVSDNTYYILSVPDDFDDSGYTKMSLSINGNTFTAYQLSDSSADGIVCLVYAVDADGNKGYYRFDTELKTFVRYYADLTAEEEVAEESSSAEEEESSVSSSGTVTVDEYNDLVEQYKQESWLKFYIIVALIVLAVILFIFVIVLAMKLKKLYNEYDFVDDTDELGEESDDEDYDYEEENYDEHLDNDNSYIDEDFRVDLSGIDDDDK